MQVLLRMWWKVLYLVKCPNWTYLQIGSVHHGKVCMDNHNTIILVNWKWAVTLFVCMCKGWLGTGKRNSAGCCCSGDRLSSSSLYCLTSLVGRSQIVRNDHIMVPRNEKWGLNRLFKSYKLDSSYHFIWRFWTHISIVTGMSLTRCCRFKSSFCLLIHGIAEKNTVQPHSSGSGSEMMERSGTWVCHGQLVPHHKIGWASPTLRSVVS